jgi:hypothetical protein
MEPPRPAGFLRVGHNGHRRLEQLLSAGNLPYDRFVFDATHVGQQLELLEALRAANREIVLETDFADSGEQGRLRPSIGRLPWANSERAWRPDDFGSHRNLDVARAIAEFAVKHQINVVLAPSHLVEDTRDPWIGIASRMCEKLREALDQAGGKSVSIDFPMITTSRILRDRKERENLTEGVERLPIDNIWLRTSGLGSDATGIGTRHFIEATRELHALGHPIVADFAGGFASVAALAFGAIGEICHGVAVHESFKASQWKRPPSNNGGRLAQRIYIPDLDRHLTWSELGVIFAARRGRSLLACNDTGCCPHGPGGMKDNAHSHFITQRSRQLTDLASIPEARRENHFLSKYLAPATRRAREASRLNITEKTVKELIVKATTRLERLRDTLEDLQHTGNSATRSRVPRLRNAARMAHLQIAR